MNISSLKIFSVDRPDKFEVVSNGDQITFRLNHIGIRFEQWPVDSALAESATEEEVLAGYQAQLAPLMMEYDFQSADVIALTPDHPDRDALRQKFLDEHTHSDFEVRFFVQGRGLFYMHVDDHVYGVMCEQGDLISVPAGIKHWFDMGELPTFKCIRLFSTPEGWVANYTGDRVADMFPRFDTF